jgi:hypothetical protein
VEGYLFSSACVCALLMEVVFGYNFFISQGSVCLKAKAGFSTIFPLSKQNKYQLVCTHITLLLHRTT